MTAPNGLLNRQFDRVWMIAMLMMATACHKKTNTYEVVLLSGNQPMESVFKQKMIVVAPAQIDRINDGGNWTVQLTYPSLNFGELGSTVMYSHPATLLAEASAVASVKQLDSTSVMLIMEVVDKRSFTYRLLGYTTHFTQGKEMDWFGDKPELRYNGERNP